MVLIGFNSGHELNQFEPRLDRLFKLTFSLSRKILTILKFLGEHKSDNS